MSAVLAALFGRLDAADGVVGDDFGPIVECDRAGLAGGGHLIGLHAAVCYVFDAFIDRIEAGLAKCDWDFCTVTDSGPVVSMYRDAGHGRRVLESVARVG